MLIISKGSAELLRLDNNGDITFATSHQDFRAGGGATAGELQITKGATELFDSAVVESRRVSRLKRRLHTQALLPTQGLILSQNGQARGVLSAGGDLYAAGDRLGAVPNPANAGILSVTSIVYAAPGLNYSGVSQGAQYAVFEAPSANYSTRTIDISDFGALPNSWPFSNMQVPINGIARIPSGPGPFPLALFAHGNHSAFENSTPGYAYLLELLASHGIIAASVDCNFLNGFNSGENDARAIVHLEHVRQFQIWNAQEGHPLQGKVDLSRVMIVGHSRGGEGVSHASIFNRLTSVKADPSGPAIPLDGSAGLGPYGFSMKAVVAIAPTDLQYTPVGGAKSVQDDYFVIHGSRDGDVWPFSGYRTYDRAHAISLANPAQPAGGTKSLLWLIGGNHNFFNSVWAREGSPTISRAEQENVAKVWIGAIAQSRLLGRSVYEEFLRDHRVATSASWIPNSIKLVSQYQDSQRLFIDHYEQADAAAPSPPLAGNIATIGMTSGVASFAGSASQDLFQETKGLRLEWSGSGGRYTINVNAGTLTRGDLQRLALRVSQSDDAKNGQTTLQDFDLSVSDGSHTYSIQASTLAELAYPAQLHTGSCRAVMQTIRIPLKRLQDNGVNTNDIRKLELIFERPQVGTSSIQGELYLDELQLSE